MTMLMGKNYVFKPTVDGCEILHQLIGGKHPMFDRVSTIQGGAGFLPPTVCFFLNILLWKITVKITVKHQTHWDTCHVYDPRSIAMSTGGFPYGGWASEILHQLIGGKHPIFDRVSTILLVMQGIATIHSMFLNLWGVLGEPSFY